MTKGSFRNLHRATSVLVRRRSRSGKREYRKTGSRILLHRRNRRRNSVEPAPWWAKLIAVMLPGLVVSGAFWPTLHWISAKRFVYIPWSGLFCCMCVFTYALTAPVPKWMRALGSMAAAAYPIALIVT